MKKSFILGSLVIFIMAGYVMSEGKFRILDGTLFSEDNAILKGIKSDVKIENDPLGNGVFLQFIANSKFSYREFNAGKPEGAKRFISSYTDEIYWFVPLAGENVNEIRPDTQFLLFDCNKKYVLIIPIIDGSMRCSLEGSHDGDIILTAESNDTDTTAEKVTGLYLQVGDNPYRMIKSAMESILSRIKIGKPRVEKPYPELINYFGWCTWNAFYTDVSYEKLEMGLETFKSMKIQPKFVILDDGWQTIGEKWRVKAYKANDKFPGDFKETVQKIKEKYGLKYFYCWYNIFGYWGGVDINSFPELTVVEKTPSLTPTMKKYLTEKQQKDYTESKGFVPPANSGAFFDGYNSYLKSQGVDGIKVDNQASLVLMGEGYGGRVEVVKTYRKALEESSRKYFGIHLLNCMACVNDIIWTLSDSNLMRVSSDWKPSVPEGGDRHVYNNAVNTFWLSELFYVDWDMFESSFITGEINAGARAISGSPVYISDKPGEQNKKLLSKLVLSDGTIPRPSGFGMPTRDCLFLDPVHSKKIFKIFNHNNYGYVIGVFNLCSSPEGGSPEILKGEIRPSDIEGILGEIFAVYSHNSENLKLCKIDEILNVELMPLTCDILTVVPVKSGFAPVGLIEKYNSGGCIKSVNYIDNSTIEVVVLDAGNFIAYCEKEPSCIKVNNKATKINYKKSENKLTVKLQDKGTNNLTIKF